MTLRRAIARLVALLRRDRLERELDDEILAHLELAERDGRARGLSSEEARRQARLAFGGIEQVKEAHRDDRSAAWLDSFLKDVRYAMAALRREPLFAGVAIALLAIGIGANAAMFSIVDAVLLRPLPFPDPDRIVRFWEVPGAGAVNSTTAQNFLEFKRRLRTFSAFSAEAEIIATAEIGGEPVRLQGRRVSFDHFDVFGIQPIIGRTFAAADDSPGAAGVLILSHAAWQAQFGGDPAILTREVRLDGEPHRIIGVLPAGAFDRDRRTPRSDMARFWKPLALTPQQIAAGSHWLNPVGRLKPGVSLTEAQQDIELARAQIDDLIPEWKRSWGVVVEPFAAVLTGDGLRQMLLLLLGAVMLVLLIACANLTNLLLTRGAARQKEIALRAALGASRARLIAQLLTESLMLGALGGLAGVGLAALLIQAAVPLLPVAVPFFADVELNGRVLVFAAAAALAVSGMVGILPALRLSRGSAAEMLNESSRGASGRHDRVRRLIVGAEVAVSLVLICGSILLFKSLLRLQQVDIGARGVNVVTAAVDIGRDKYPTPERAAAFYRQLVAEVSAVPGVRAAAMAGDMPLEGTGGELLRWPGREDERLTVRFKRAGSGYFTTLGIPIVAGREFTDGDLPGSPYVTVINETLAAQLRDRFGVDAPLGRLVDLPALGFGSPSTRQRMLIVGIVKNERVRSDLRMGEDAIAYVPMAQAPILWTKLAVRIDGDAALALPMIRDRLRRIDSRVALADVRTLEDLRQLSLSGAKEPAWLVGAFAVLAAGLAALGLYGVVAHAVSQQRREIGIRMALGAQSRDVLSMIVCNVTFTVGGGLVVGLAAAAAVTRVTSSLLFQVSALDPAAFAIAAAAMAALAFLGAAIPARRAARVDPTIALRTE